MDIFQLIDFGSILKASVVSTFVISALVIVLNLELADKTSATKEQLNKAGRKKSLVSLIVTVVVTLLFVEFKTGGFREYQMLFLQLLLVWSVSTIIYKYLGVKLLHLFVDKVWKTFRGIT